MNKLERFHAAVAGRPVDRVPVSLWLHFVTDYVDGAESARLQARFFRQYDLDLAKVVNDYRYPLPNGMETLEGPDDMLRIETQPMSHRSYAEQLRLLAVLRADLGPDWPIVDTTFDPLQQIMRRTGWSTTRLVFDHPRQAKPMLEAATETVCRYVRELKRLGVDGVLYSTRGAVRETHSKGVDEATFEEFYRPYDTVVLEEMAGMVRILHACQAELNLARVRDYPHEVLSWWDRHPSCPSLAEMRADGDKCLMGGIEQTGAIERSLPELRAEIEDAMHQAEGGGFILAPGCTIFSHVPGHILAAIVQTARGL
ncbi:MAG: uroporphyrinogen decarboxylase family protein [Alphaproteobacteria bacterium]|jgi:uroporphyrinogen decarboxylase|nr:uroporphyrinogen decarboxylase family protein [Alphaproteobacteria bacterium]